MINMKSVKFLSAKQSIEIVQYIFTIPDVQSASGLSQDSLFWLSATKGKSIIITILMWQNLLKTQAIRVI